MLSILCGAWDPGRSLKEIEPPSFLETENGMDKTTKTHCHGKHELCLLPRRTRCWLCHRVLVIDCRRFPHGKFPSAIILINVWFKLSDVIAILVAWFAIRLAASLFFKPKYTYRYQRAELLGAMINAVFLITLCFTIFIQVIQRVFKPEPIDRAVLVLIVGIIGLLMNLIGLFLFKGMKS